MKKQKLKLHSLRWMGGAAAAALLAVPSANAQTYDISATGVVSDGGGLSTLNGITLTPGLTTETEIYSFDIENFQTVRSNNGQPYWYSDSQSSFSFSLQTGTSSYSSTGNGMFINVFPSSGIPGWPSYTDQIIIGSATSFFMTFQFPANTIQDSSLNELSLLNSFPTGGTVTLTDYGPGYTPVVTAPTTFTIQTTPEPATLALAGLGGVSLLLFRRRK